LRYLRERDRLLGAVPKSNAADNTKDEEVNEDQGKSVKEQRVYVLDRGFVGWQENYGEDERLTEGYRKELWKDGYWM
jgi:Cdc25 family phosphatase